DIGGEKQRRKLRWRYDSRADRRSRRNRLLSRKLPISDKDADMIDAHGRNSRRLFGGGDFINLRQHEMCPRRRRTMSISSVGDDTKSLQPDIDVSVAKASAGRRRLRVSQCR